MATASDPARAQCESTTALLIQLRQGNRDAETRLLGGVYDELRRIAAAHMRSERPNHTLQPTALVHEAYARLIQEPHISFHDRVDFFGIASKRMRRVLVDYARTRNAAKQGGMHHQVTLDDALGVADSRCLDVLALEEALCRLEQLDQRQAKIVELHFFGGLSFEEIANVLDVSLRTAKRDWAMARAWLHGELSTVK